MSRDREIKRAIRAIIRQAKETDPELTAFSMRNVKEQLSERMGIKMTEMKESPLKGLIKRTVDEIIADDDEASSQSPTPGPKAGTSPSAKREPSGNGKTKRSDSESPAKTARSRKTSASSKQAPPSPPQSASASPSGSGSRAATASPDRSARKRKAESDSPEKRGFMTTEEARADGYSSMLEDEDEEDSRQSKKPKSKSTDAPAKGKRRKSGASHGSEDEEDDDDGSSEEGGGAKRKKGAGGASARGGKGKGAGKGGKAAETALEAELRRLKALVVACGVRKQWKRWFEDQGCGAGEDGEADAATQRKQKKAVLGLLEELGMTGRLSMKKAQQIRDEREFKMELQDIGVLKEPKTRSSRARAGSDAASDSASEGESDSEDERIVRKKGSFKNSLASFAAELNSSQ